ncbi:MAG TPA: polyprenyl diphosphate synthase [Patescibacteria group bacterium]|nr:polyprenyl diphosphate synthase [Patescibacteria group bacterium]
MDGSGLPNHIAIIPDGNRRWAKENNLPKLEGHRRGAETAVRLAKYLRKLGIHTLTLWVFSTENASRDAAEVKNLMRLFEQYFDRLVKDALEDNVRLVHLGRRDRLPESLLKKIVSLEEKTREFTDYTLNIALDYGGRDEILRAVSRIMNKEERIMNEEEFGKYLDTGGQKYPDPDLIIRTSGEMRMSGLLPWQSVYSEYYFFEKYFPDLSEQDIDQALEEYKNRKRRFGK